MGSQWQTRNCEDSGRKHLVGRRRHVIPSLWVDLHSVLPNNKGQAMKSYHMLNRRFHSHQERKVKYVELINQMLDDDHNLFVFFFTKLMKPLPRQGNGWSLTTQSSVAKSQAKEGWLMIVEPNKVVYFLNYVLLTTYSGRTSRGIVWWDSSDNRKEKVAVTSDIGSIFLQVMVPPVDRAALR